MCFRKKYELKSVWKKFTEGVKQKIYTKNNFEKAKTINQELKWFKVKPRCAKWQSQKWKNELKNKS